MKPVSFLSGAIAAAALAVSIPGMAQAPGTAPPPLVRLEILAFDAKGQPVTDLAQSELQVTDQGKQQRIVYFQRRAGAMPAPAGAVSNRAALPPTTTAILFDLMNQPQADSRLASKKVGRWLSSLPSGEGIYLYVLGVDGIVFPVHPIPSNSYVAGAEDKTWTKPIEEQFDKLMKTMIHTRPAGILQEDSVKKTYVAMENLAKQLQVFSGERNILWVMRDVPTIGDPRGKCSGDWLDCALYIPHLQVTLEHAGVPVNPVSYANITDPNTNRGMEDFAGLTSGRPFFGDELPGLLTKLRTDAAGGYTVGYEPASDTLDNKFHRVKVLCERKGIKIETRYRYYAYPDTRPPQARAMEALTAALKSPFDASQIGLWGKAVPVPGGQKAVHLDLRIDASSLLLRGTGSNLSAQVAVVLAGYSDTGVMGSPMPTDFTLNLTKEQYEAGKKDGLPFTPDFPIADGMKKVRMLIYDHSTGALGSLTLPVGGQ